VNEPDRFFPNKPGTERGTPFGEEYWVYKLMGKMFALISWQDDPVNMNFNVIRTWFKIQG